MPFSTIGFHAASDEEGREWGAASALIGSYLRGLSFDDAFIVYVTPDSTHVTILTTEDASKLKLKYDGKLPTADDILLTGSKTSELGCRLEQHIMLQTACVHTSNVHRRCWVKANTSDWGSLVETLRPVACVGQSLALAQMGHDIRVIFSL
jgi:hypothetical protein